MVTLIWPSAIVSDWTCARSPSSTVSTFWGFPFEAIPSLNDRIDLIEAFFDWCHGLEPDCPGDIDGDGTVGVTDFLEILAAWGPNPGHPADLDGDDMVGITDFLELLALWGPCP